MTSFRRPTGSGRRGESARGPTLGGGIGGSTHVDAPALSLANLSQFTGSYIVGDNVEATATTSDVDGHTTTGVQLWANGSLVGSMLQGPTGTWTLVDSSIAQGSRDYYAKRIVSGGGSANSSTSSITALGTLTPAQVTTATLVERWRCNESINIATALVSTGTSPPAIVASGTRTVPLALYLRANTAGGNGVGKVDISIDGGTSWAHTGVTFTFGATQVITGGGGLSITFPGSGTISADNTWTGVCSVMTALVTPSTNDFTNGTAGQRPTVLSAVAADGSIPAIKMDGSDDRLITSGSIANNEFGGTNNSFFLVVQCRLNAILATGTIFAAVHSTNASLPHVQIRATTTNYEMERRASGADLSTVSSVVVPQVGYHLFELYFDGTVGTLRVNGADVCGGDSGIPNAGQAATLTCGAITLDRLCIGGKADQAGFNGPASIQYYEIALFSTQPSALELEQLRRYF